MLADTKPSRCYLESTHVPYVYYTDGNEHVQYVCMYIRCTRIVLCMGLRWRNSVMGTWILQVAAGCSALIKARSIGDSPWISTGWYRNPWPAAKTRLTAQWNPTPVSGNELKTNLWFFVFIIFFYYFFSQTKLPRRWIWRRRDSLLKLSMINLKSKRSKVTSIWTQFIWV